MAIIKRVAEVTYTCEQMYELVNSIEEYPEFLPWCTASEILKSTDNEIIATLNLSKGGLTKSFTTINRLQKNKMIEVRLVEGPFRHLEGFWQFENLPSANSSRISFYLEFEFRNLFLEMALGSLFNQVANTLVDSFIERAHTKYAAT